MSKAERRVVGCSYSGHMLACIERLIPQFFLDVTDPEERFYNEASLQHELALHLRNRLPSGLRVHIERPASWFRPTAAGLVKKEIDLAIADDSREQIVAIELKCPRQGQHPEQMFKACQDLQFLEQLVVAGFLAGGVAPRCGRFPIFCFDVSVMADAAVAPTITL